jgi:hypothetical protein
MICNESLEKISPMDAWTIYTSCKLHFSPDKNFNAFDYNFKGPRCRRETFNAMNNRYHYEKIAKQCGNRKNTIEYFVSNIIQDKTWIGDMNIEIYENWKGKLQNMSYRFRQDLNIIKDCEERFDRAIMPEDSSQIPLIYRLYKSGEISLETLACLELLVSYTSGLNKKLSDPLDISRVISHRVSRYAPFLKKAFDRKKYQDIAILLFTQQTN